VPIRSLPSPTSVAVFMMTACSWRRAADAVVKPRKAEPALRTLCRVVRTTMGRCAARSLGLLVSKASVCSAPVGHCDGTAAAGGAGRGMWTPQGGAAMHAGHRANLGGKPTAKTA